jgi:hypothetical protein
MFPALSCGFWSLSYFAELKGMYALVAIRVASCVAVIVAFGWHSARRSISRAAEPDWAKGFWD